METGAQPRLAKVSLSHANSQFPASIKSQCCGILCSSCALIPAFTSLISSVGLLSLLLDPCFVCSVPVSAVVSAALAWVWLHVLSQPDARVTSEYRLGVVATAAGVVVEMVAQPLAILAQAMLFVKLKVRTGRSRANSCGWVGEGKCETSIVRS